MYGNVLMRIPTYFHLTASFLCISPFPTAAVSSCGFLAHLLLYSPPPATLHAPFLFFFLSSSLSFSSFLIPSYPFVLTPFPISFASASLPLYLLLPSFTVDCPVTSPLLLVPSLTAPLVLCFSLSVTCSLPLVYLSSSTPLVLYFYRYYHYVRFLVTVSSALSFFVIPLFLFSNHGFITSSLLSPFVLSYLPVFFTRFPHYLFSFVVTSFPSFLSS